MLSRTLSRLTWMTGTPDCIGVSDLLSVMSEQSYIKSCLNNTHVCYAPFCLDLAQHASR